MKRRRDEERDEYLFGSSLLRFKEAGALTGRFGVGGVLGTDDISFFGVTCAGGGALVVLVRLVVFVLSFLGVLGALSMTIPRLETRSVICLSSPKVIPICDISSIGPNEKISQALCNTSFFVSPFITPSQLLVFTLYLHLLTSRFSQKVERSF